MVHAEALAMQLRGDAAVPISGEFLDQRLDPTDEGGVVRSGRPRPVVIAAPREAHECAPPRGGGEQGPVGGQERPLLSTCARLRCKAFFKNSFSSVSLPTICSNWRTRSSRATSWAGSAPNPLLAYCFFQW